jgi:hypothetical protein
MNSPVGVIKKGIHIMSSARNHKIRSHRSYKNSVAAMNRMQKQGYVRSNTQAFKNNFFTRFLKMFKKNTESK